MRIVFVGGGTGGHIFPIRSLIQGLQQIGTKITEDKLRRGSEELFFDNHGSKFSDISVFWIGEKNSLEQKVAEELGVEFYSIFSGKLRRYLTPISILQNLRDLLKIVIGFFQSLYFLYKSKIDIIFCKGGYVAIPVVLAGALLRKKIFVHESDTIPGLTNKIAAKFSKKVFWGFFFKGEIEVGRESKEVGRGKKLTEDKNIKKFFSILKNSYKILGGEEKVVSVGQILSDELIQGLQQIGTEITEDKFGNGLEDKSSDNSLINILVIGGSQGAKAIFDTLLSIARKNLYKFEEKRRNIMIDEKYNFFIVLGTKNKGYKHYFAGFENVEVFEFVDQKKMGQLLWVADRSITRGGATSLAEQDVFGVSKIIIPLPFTAHNHQWWNGMWYKIFRGDLLLEQNEELEKNLQNILLEKQLSKKVVSDIEEIANKIKMPKNRIVKEILNID